MRTQCTFHPTFWTRGSGKKLRGDSDAQVLAIYFMNSPQSTMIGLYYEPLISILHNTGLSEEAFRRVLPKVAEIALYDESESLVYLPNGAERQIGETLSIKDNKRKAILAQLKVYGNHEFVKQWLEKYYDPYNFSYEGITKPLRSPFVAPSTPLLEAPDPRSDPSPRSDPREKADVGSEVPIIASLQVRAQTWVRNPMMATLSYPDPHRWYEALELRDLVASTFGIEPDTLQPPTANGSLDTRVRMLLERWAEGTDQARMRLAIRGAKNNDLIAGKPELQSLQTIFKDANAVDKYCRSAKAATAAGPVDKSNRVKLTPEATEKRRKFLAGE